MKKRMFLSTILMTLVLLLAVTTATFAWYTVESSGNATLSSTAADLNTVTGTYTADSVALTGTITTSDSVAMTDADGNTYVLVNGQKILAQNDATVQKVGTATLSVAWPALSGTSQEQLAQKLTYAGTYTVTISGSRVKLAKTNEVEGKDAEAIEATAGASITLTVSISAVDGSITVENGGVFYFAIDGGSDSQNDGTSAISFAINATMGDKA